MTMSREQYEELVDYFGRHSIAHTRENGAA